MRERSLAGALALLLLLAACGGESAPEEPEENVGATESSAVASSEAVSESSAATTSTTTTTPPETVAESGPIDFAIDGSCRVDVFREDENGTTWIMICNLAHGGTTDAPVVLRSTEHSAHFQYVVDENDERVGIVLQSPRVQGRNCMWSHDGGFQPAELDIVDDVVSYDGALVGGFGCESMSVSYTFTWDTTTDTAHLEGVLDEGT